MDARERSRSRDVHLHPSQTAPGLAYENGMPVSNAGWSAALAHQAPPQFHMEFLLGKGSFGAVWKASVNGRSVAVKSVRVLDGGREVQVLRELRNCPNVVSLLGLFVGNEVNEKDRALNLVLEYIPDTLQRIIRHHRYKGLPMHMQHVRLYAYQLLRGLGSLVRKGVVHRDFKPANLLVEPRSLHLKVCDFGTAKMPGEEEPHQPYLCSRFYRAPELILSARESTHAVDLWAAGCILVELIRGQVLFQGKDGIDQMLHIVEICGTPTPAEFYAMNRNYDAAVGFNPRLEPVPWAQVLGPRAPPEAAALVGRLLRYDPSKRPMPFEAMASDFFDQLRRTPPVNHDGTIQDPNLFRFRPEELEHQPPNIRERLLAVNVHPHGGVRHMR